MCCQQGLVFIPVWQQVNPPASSVQCSAIPYEANEEMYKLAFTKDLDTITIYSPKFLIYLSKKL